MCLGIVEDAVCVSVRRPLPCPKKEYLKHLRDVLKSKQAILACQGWIEQTVLPAELTSLDLIVDQDYIVFRSAKSKTAMLDQENCGTAPADGCV